MSILMTTQFLILAHVIKSHIYKKYKTTSVIRAKTNIKITKMSNIAISVL